MKGLDANVLARYLTQDDPAQSRVVDTLVSKAIDEGEPLHIDDIVLCELVWVLRGAYRKEKAVIVNALEKITGTALFSFNDREVLRQAIVDYRGGGGDFADYLIGRRNQRAGCEHTASFDRALRGARMFSIL